jgi:hypothetical protein
LLCAARGAKARRRRITRGEPPACARVPSRRLELARSMPAPPRSGGSIAATLWFAAIAAAASWLRRHRALESGPPQRSPPPSPLPLWGDRGVLLPPLRRLRLSDGWLKSSEAGDRKRLFAAARSEGREVGSTMRRARAQWNGARPARLAPLLLRLSKTHFSPFCTGPGNGRGNLLGARTAKERGSRPFCRSLTSSNTSGAPGYALEERLASCRYTCRR